MFILLALLLQSATVSPDPREEINVELEYGDNGDRAVDRDLLPAQERDTAAARATFEQSNRQLAVEYGLTMDAMAKADQSWAKRSPGYSKRLSAAQESWSAYRNAQCRIATDFGPGWNLVKMEKAWSCLDLLNRERVKQLVALRAKGIM